VRLALLLWLLCHPALGWSQQESVPKANAKQDKPHPDRRGTPDSPFVVKMADPDDAKERAERITQEEQRKAEIERDMLLANQRLAKLAFVQVVLICIQLYMIWRTETTTKRQLRAYVFGSVMVSDPNSARGVNFTLTVTNSGQTPAYDSTFVFSSRHVDYFPGLPLPDLRGVPTQGWQSKGPIPPGGTFVSVIKAPAFTADDMAALGDGIKAVYAFGEIRYTDAFGTGRSTKFRFLFGGDVGVAAGPLATTADGNDAD
jgi:hypothetical protein